MENLRMYEWKIYKMENWWPIISNTLFSIIWVMFIWKHPINMKVKHKLNYADVISGREKGERASTEYKGEVTDEDNTWLIGSEIQSHLIARGWKQWVAFMSWNKFTFTCYYRPVIHKFNSRRKYDHQTCNLTQLTWLSCFL